MTAQAIISETTTDEDNSLVSDEESENEPTYQELTVSKKAWIIRISLLFSLMFLMTNNIIVALEIGDSLIFYSTLMPIQTISVFFIGWFFFKNHSKGKKVTSHDLVSVVIPIFNQKNIIDRVIDAISNSTYKNIEIIAVNDGSSDGTREILDYLNSIYPKLTVIHQSNAGKRRAVSTGFYASKGKYVDLYRAG